MPLRVLHTSDWHLGASLENASREEEQKQFLSWLLTLLRTEAIELLVVAGDIFQYAQPSTEAQRLYYQFLARAGLETGLRQVVVVGGNHDSAARLDAPREVLDVLKVHVVGGLPAGGPSAERMLCPVHDGEGRLQAVVAAVPYVHEFRLGIRTTGRSREEIRADFEAAFRKLYGGLAEEAAALYPGVPLLATGHLACVGTQKGDYQSEIHQIGTIDALPGSVFDPRFAYVALGHIHRMFPVSDSSAWYSGTPLAMNVTEAASPRYVLKVALTEETTSARHRVSVTPLPVPTWRRMVSLEGSEATILPQLFRLARPDELPPFLYVSFVVEAYQPLLAHRLQEALEALPSARRPLLVEVRQRLTGGGNLGEERPGGPNLRDLQPEEVFARLFQERYQAAVPDSLRIAFREVVSSLEADEH